MRIEGRTEKRAIACIPVILMATHDRSFAEQVTTLNMSSQGACVISKRYWHPGEQLRVVTTNGEFHRPAHVVYSQALSDQRFYVGLQFTAPDSSSRSHSWSTLAHHPSQ
jgi:hypothetical protein